MFAVSDVAILSIWFMMHRCYHYGLIHDSELKTGGVGIILEYWMILKTYVVTICILYWRNLSNNLCFSIVVRMVTNTLSHGMLILVMSVAMASRKLIEIIQCSRVFEWILPYFFAVMLISAWLWLAFLFTLRNRLLLCCVSLYL